MSLSFQLVFICQSGKSKRKIFVKDLGKNNEKYSKQIVLLKLEVFQFGNFIKIIGWTVEKYLAQC